MDTTLVLFRPLPLDALETEAPLDFGLTVVGDVIKTFVVTVDVDATGLDSTLTNDVSPIEAFSAPELPVKTL